MDVSLSKLQGIVEDREAWCAVVHGVTEIQTWLSNWKTKHLLWRPQKLFTWTWQQFFRKSARLSTIIFSFYFLPAIMKICKRSKIRSPTLNFNMCHTVPVPMPLMQWHGHLEDSRFSSREWMEVGGLLLTMVCGTQYVRDPLQNTSQSPAPSKCSMKMA